MMNVDVGSQTVDLHGKSIGRACTPHPCTHMTRTTGVRADSRPRCNTNSSSHPSLSVTASPRMSSAAGLKPPPQAPKTVRSGACRLLTASTYGGGERETVHGLADKDVGISVQRAATLRSGSFLHVFSLSRFLSHGLTQRSLARVTRPTCPSHSRDPNPAIMLGAELGSRCCVEVW